MPLLDCAALRHSKFVIRQSAVRRVAEQARILIVKLSSLGDLFHALPTVHNLKVELGVELDWVTQAEYADLVRCFPDVDRVIPFPRHDFLLRIELIQLAPQHAEALHAGQVGAQPLELRDDDREAGQDLVEHPDRLGDDAELPAARRSRRDVRLQLCRLDALHARAARVAYRADQLPAPQLGAAGAV